ncbi:kinase-like protein [Eremomyces bilateralis CBS 781.70]|uniref:Kinase-like protein n=1 Tax=Eremomyces bilateralis CBS 781.70 TaxID=1392243 RepID=A0A6G1G4L8_9PEZI|nr:kinase-like protein [Eremomyces bilateralis CBS 781.70]KAF1812779.1 kinase-like protein [Eremomyces bilateralis CBS 781.70]
MAPSAAAQCPKRSSDEDSNTSNLSRSSTWSRSSMTSPESDSFRPSHFDPTSLVDGIPHTPPMRIPSQSPGRIAQRRNQEDIPLPEKRLDFNQVQENASKKKKKKRGMKPGAPATTTVRGFYTPVTSGGEESESSVANTPRVGPTLTDLPSITSSPGLRPTSAAGQVSALQLQLAALNSRTDSRASTLRTVNNSGYGTPRSDSDRGSDGEKYAAKTRTCDVEVPLEQDFVSAQVSLGANAIGTESQLSNGREKMTEDDFTALKYLGKGAYGTVSLVKHKESGRLYAQKQLRKASLLVYKQRAENAKTERNVLESINRHPFIVKLFYAFQDQEKLYLILQYAPGGELFQHLREERMLPETTVSFYMAEMILALHYLHSEVGVVYRDLKPENCLLDADGHLLLTDFGLCKERINDGERCSTMAGTVPYMAPEMIDGRSYGFSVDWWALGAIGYDLLTGSYPFKGNNDKALRTNIVKAKLNLPYYLSPDAKDLLTRLMRKEPNKRLGAHMPKDLDTLKKHRFFRAIDWRKLARREAEPPIQPLITDPELAENFAREFTEVPVEGPGGGMRAGIDEMYFRENGGDGVGLGVDVDMEDPFGGFSFTASESLLETGEFFC